MVPEQAGNAYKNSDTVSKWVSQMAFSVMRARVARKGRLVIPKRLRAKVELKEGDYVQLELRNGEIVMTKEPSNAVDALKGLFVNVWPRKQTSIEIQRKLRKEWRARERS